MNRPDLDIVQLMQEKFKSRLVSDFPVFDSRIEGGRIYCLLNDTCFLITKNIPPEGEIDLYAGAAFVSASYEQHSSGLFIVYGKEIDPSREVR
jgi:hypothetical protein